MPVAVCPNSRPRRGRAALLLVALVAVGTPACTRTLDAEVLHQAIASGLNEQLALPIASVSCPADRPIAANDSFDCTATPVAGGELTVTVTQSDEEGNINWKVSRTDGLMDLQLVEASVAEGLRSQAQVEATVTCGDRWKKITPGDVFSCEARVADGEAVAVEVTTTDGEGNISWKVG